MRVNKDGTVYLNTGDYTVSDFVILLTIIDDSRIIKIKEEECNNG